MAGMLPGVETARRRRLHQTSGLLDSSSSITSTSSFGYNSRRYSLCFYAPSSHESQNNSSMQRNPRVQQIGLDEKLDEAAREAKERLDKKLNGVWKSRKSRGSKNHQQRTHTGVSGPTKSVSKRFNWMAKLRWRHSDNAECAVCLENFKGGQTLMELPCNHRFHSRCLLPWLATSPRCPCCRFQISLE